MKAVVAYIPVLHEGYRRVLHAHPPPVHLIGPELGKALPDLIDRILRRP